MIETVFIRNLSVISKYYNYNKRKLFFLLIVFLCFLRPDIVPLLLFF